MGEIVDQVALDAVSVDARTMAARRADPDVGSATRDDHGPGQLVKTSRRLGRGLRLRARRAVQRAGRLRPERDVAAMRRALRGRQAPRSRRIETSHLYGRHTFAGHLDDHENALRDWLKSELDGKSDGAEKVFAYLERYGITRKDAVVPREDREDFGGDKQLLVLAFFDTEDAADRAAKAMRDWEKATEYMKVDAVGVLVKGKDGKVKEHKLGKRAGKRGMGIGVVLGLIAAIPSGGLSLAGGVLGGAAGGGVTGEFFHKGLKMTDEDTARIGREMDAGHAAIGVLTWDFETESVSKKLAGLGGTPETHEVANVTPEAG
jgi:uncharacterized membrane protein